MICSRLQRAEGYEALREKNPESEPGLGCFFRGHLLFLPRGTGVSAYRERSASGPPAGYTVCLLCGDLLSWTLRI